MTNGLKNHTLAAQIAATENPHPHDAGDELGSLFGQLKHIDTDEVGADARDDGHPDNENEYSDELGVHALDDGNDTFDEPEHDPLVIWNQER